MRPPFSLTDLADPAHSVFNIGRNGTDAVGFAPKTALKKSTNVGAIVGGTVGGVAGLLLAGLAAFFYVRSRRDRAHLKDTVAEFEEHKVASTIQPFTLGARRDSPGVHARLLPEDDVAPPTYEASEAGAASTVASGGPVRVSKSEYAQPPAASATAVLPEEEGVSGSSQPAPRIEPNRIYNIEE